jgi:hypothetical protein
LCTVFGVSILFAVRSEQLAASDYTTCSTHWTEILLRRGDRRQSGLCPRRSCGVVVYTEVEIPPAVR